MKKKNKKHGEEIDLLQVLKVILNVSVVLWKKKISIIIIAFVSLLIGAGYDHQKSTYFKYSLTISPSNNLEFLKLEDLFFKVKIDDNKNVEVNEKQNEINIMLLERFNRELLDYEEIMHVLKNDLIIKDSLSELPLMNQQKALFSYAKSLKISPSKDVKDQYIINFILKDSIDGINILDQTLKLTSNNLKRSIIDELNNRLTIKKDFEFNNDLKEIEFLSEQNLIAKELNIDEPDMDVSLSENYPVYFLKGYKAIEKEINIIKNRKYQHLTNIQNDINKFNDLDIKWVDYNLFLAGMESSNFRNIKVISILIGLVVGCLFVIFSNLSRLIK